MNRRHQRHLIRILARARCNIRGIIIPRVRRDVVGTRRKDQIWATINKAISSNRFWQRSINQNKRKGNVVYAKEYNLHNELYRKIYSDQAGKFPVMSFCGNIYIMVLFNLDSNNILCRPIRNRTSGKMMRLYQKLID